jgi:hypothetical protein
MIKHAESHLDHNLTEAQVAFILERFADKRAFFIETIELPDALGTVPCGLHGPLVGGTPIVEADVTYAKRGTREWTSRLIDRAPQAVRTVTVIAGPHEEKCWHCDGSGGIGEWKARIPCGTCDHGKVKHACILYTCYGGPCAPQEPGDLKAQKNAVEAQRLGLSDLTDEHKTLTAKRDALREKLTASRAFWSEHALSR